MKVLVSVKRVPDYAVKVKLRADGASVETEGVKWIVNPFDEIAVEEALKLREAGMITEITVISIGPEEAAPQIRHALAMGADKGILVKHGADVDSDLAARVIAEVYRRGDYQLIIMGKQAIDSDCSQTPQNVAARLGLPQGTFASKVKIEGKEVLVTREVDGGLETVKLPLPAVISTDLRLNTPRYASLPGIMAAKKKPLEILPLSDLGVEPNIKVKALRMALPPKRSAGKKVQSVTELVTLLQTEAKVL
jgi:electron transfer flavoprotein beta subunit